MKADIIETDYIYNNSIHKIWKVLTISYGIALIFLTTLDGFEALYKYKNSISMLSKIFLGSGILFTLLNTFLFSRIGRLEIEKDLMRITVNDVEKNIDLSTIEQVTFGKDSKNFYYLKVTDSELIIELSKSQLSNFKKTLETFNVKIKHRHFTDRISGWFSKNIKS